MTTWPDLATLELLVALADEGSLSAAARRCRVAQPNASRSIARLERDTGLSLVHRATTGAKVTTDGLLVVEWARTTLEAARALGAGVNALREHTQTPLAVMASQTVAEHLLPKWIAAWQHASSDPGAQAQPAGSDEGAHPLGAGSRRSVKAAPAPTTPGISVAVGNTTDVLVAARAGELDLGFVEGPGAPRGVNSAVVAHDDLVLVVAPTHPWAARGAVRAEQVAATPLVTRESGSGTRVALQRALTPLALVEPALELASNAAVRVSAAAGTAPAVLSRLAVSDALTSGSLVEVGIDGVDLRRNLRAVWPGPRRLTHPAAAALLAAATTSSSWPTRRSG